MCPVTLHGRYHPFHAKPSLRTSPGRDVPRESAHQGLPLPKSTHRGVHVPALNHRYTSDPSFAHRQGSTRLVLTGPDGAPLARREVELAQRRHDFGFACINPGFVGAVESTATELPG